MSGFLFLVMPYVAGETLRQRLRRERHLKVEEVLGLARDVGAGLAAAHSHGVLHRDIKPENILLENGRALVADFGIAKAFTDAAVDTITSTGLGIGTPAYMSPEQASGERQLDERTDVYGLACVVYEMLAGETPYTGHSAQALIAKKLSNPVPAVRVLRDTLSPALDAVLRKGLAKLPADRYATVDEFIAALAPALQAGELTRSPAMRESIAAGLRAHPVGAAVAVVLALAVGLWGWRAVRAPGADWVGGRPNSVVVIPFHTSSASAEERGLSGALAEAITRELNQWESIRAVPNVSLTGPMFDLGLEGPTLAAEGDGIRLARQVRVQALLAILVRVNGDSVHAQASLIDVGRGRPARQPVFADARRTDLAALVRPIASDILGLGGDTPDPATLRRMSPFPDAVVAHLEGVQALDRGRVAEAEQSFRRALRIDSGFAMARHHLALSLFVGARARPRLAALAPEIAQLSTSAMSRATGLSRGDSLRIAAFHSFLSGDYPGARAAYTMVLTDDPTDVYSLLMRGIVELFDPWLVVVADSAYRPRSNPNVAIRDLSEILRLRPPFDLGYDNLSEVYRKVNDAAERSVCPGFELPKDKLRLPWESGTADEQAFFCPVIRSDSIAWVNDKAFRTIDRSLVRAGASRFFEQYLALVRRWATYAKNEVRPREEMATALLAQRRRLGLAAPERIAAVSDSALRFAESALLLKADTTSDDLARLGNMVLAAGDYTRARRIAERMLNELPRQQSAPRIMAANPFLATGQPSRAMQIRSAVPFQRFIPDPATGEMIPFGGAELPIARIQILGASGIGGAALQRELRDVFRLWSESRYNDRHRRALRERATTEIAAALMLEPDVMASWNRGVTVNDPLWRSLVLTSSDATQARRLLQTAMDSATSAWTEATRSYLQGIIAGRLGDHRLAIARFSRLDSLPLSTESIDTGWGFRSLSLLRRAESWEALGDTTQARKHYDLFARWWASPDTLVRPLVQQAAGRAARLGKRS